MANFSENNCNKKIEIKDIAEYEQLVPPLTPIEFINLKQSIKESNGNIIPILVNREGIIVDGHHRYRACKELGFEPNVEVKGFDDPLAEKEFVIEINVKRRQLNNFQLSMLAYKLEDIYKERAKIRQLSKLKDVKDKLLSPLTQFCANGNREEESEVGKVSEIVAKKTGLSSRTYEMAKTIIKEGTEEQKNLLIQGKSSTSINREYNKIKKKKKKKELESAVPKIELPESCKLINNDFAISQIPDNSIDLIFTDPPYGYEPLPIYEQLTKFANRVLKSGGSLVFLLGQIALDKVIKIFDNSDLKYWWILSVKHSGSSRRVHPRYVFAEWKPLLWYVKGENGPFNVIDTMGDFIISKPPEKILHLWEQSTVEAEHIIKYLTVENQIVLDPMMGTGTTGLAALNLNRKFIGIEKNYDEFKIAEKRLASHFQNFNINFVTNNKLKEEKTEPIDNSVLHLSTSLKNKEEKI